MDSRRVTCMAFFDEEGRVLLQDRRSISKRGEEWGFFGGGIEPGETPEQGIVRELQEELELTVSHPEFLGRFAYETPDLHREIFVYMMPVPDLDSLVLREGDGMALFTPAEVAKLKMMPLDPFIVAALHKKRGFTRV